MNRQQQINNEIKGILDYSRPYFPTAVKMDPPTSQINTFPYKQFYRGQAGSYRSIIMDREAGFVDYRTDMQPLGAPTIGQSDMRQLVPLCFQTPSSTTMPCTDKLVPLKSNIVISI